MNRLEVYLKIPAHAAEICRRSVEIETQSEALLRSKVELSCAGEGLKMTVDAADLSSMRAALNTYLRWISMCVDLTENRN